MHYMLRAAEVSPRGAVQPLVRVRSMLRAHARVPVLPRASDDVARPATCVIRSNEPIRDGKKRKRRGGDNHKTFSQARAQLRERLQRVCGDASGDVRRSCRGKRKMVWNRKGSPSPPAPPPCIKKERETAKRDRKRQTPNRELNNTPSFGTWSTWSAVINRTRHIQPVSRGRAGVAGSSKKRTQRAG